MLIDREKLILAKIANNIFYTLKIGLLLAVISVSSCATEFRAINVSILKEADELPKIGVLKEKKGYMYLKLDDEYIHKLYPIIQEFDDNAQEPPYFRTSESIGAHVSVINKTESQRLNIMEINKNFHFTINKLKLVGSKSIRYYVLEVESPELEELRQKYDLPKFLQGFKFHITLATKEPS